MNTHAVTRKFVCALMLSIGLIAAGSVANAHGGGGGGGHGGGGGWHGGGGGWHGGYDGAHGNWGHGGYGYGGWGATGVVVGVPLGGYYATQCQIINQCDQYGNCYQRQVCN